MRSGSGDADLTARATIRNTALRLFAERGPDAVTVREIAAAAGVSAGLVLHHFGSKAGLRQAVDDYAAGAFDEVMKGLEGTDLKKVLTGEDLGSIAEAFSRGFPQESPLPGYLRRLLLSNDPAGAALFRRWYDASVALLDFMVASGIAKPSRDPAIRAAFLLVNDLALVLLRHQLADALGSDPLSREGMARWAAEVTAAYAEGVFSTPLEESGKGSEVPEGEAK